MAILILTFTDVIKNVCPNRSKEENKEIIERASSSLKKVFGIKLVELPDKNEFILINCLPINHTSAIETHVSSQCALGILLPVLALIFMNGTETKEGSYTFHNQVSVKHYLFFSLIKPPFGSF